MNLVDSSAWLEYFSGGTAAKYFEAPLQDTASLLVPSIVIYEVFKVVMRESGEKKALQALAALQKGMVVELTSRIAIAAAKCSLQHNLPMADSIIFATAHAYSATIWTQDADFKQLPGVKYFSKKQKG